MEIEEAAITVERTQSEKEPTGRNIVVHFVRHGEMASYRPQAGLTENGRKQSFEAGKSLLAKIGKGGLVKFVFSPLQRAQESSEEMIKGLREAIKESQRDDVRLYTPRREGRLRPFDTRDETKLRQLKREGKDVIGHWLRGFISEEEVESPASVLERVQGFIERRRRMSRRLPEGPTIHYVCVTHSPFMRALLKDAFGEDLGEPKMGESIEVLFTPDRSPQVEFRERTTEQIS